MKNKGYSTQLLFALVVILVGVLLLFNNLGLASVGGLWKWIPSLFILMGIWQLVTTNFRHRVGPAILIIGGAIFQLAALEAISWGTLGQIIWPLVIIGIGLLILLRRTEFGQRFASTAADNPDDVVRGFAIFSGDERHVTSQSFTGGEGTALFGGVDIDLRDAAVREPPATISATALFGGVDIIVPTDWVVRLDVFGLFGGSGDERPTKGVPDHGQGPDLIVTGTAMFGGVTVKSPEQKSR